MITMITTNIATVITVVKITFHYFRALRATFERCHHKTKRIVTRIIIVFSNISPIDMYGFVTFTNASIKIQ